MENGSVVHTHAVNGIFRIGKDNINFEATSMKCFQVVIAFRLTGVFHLKYAFIVQKNGIMCNLVQQSLENLDGLYQIPPELDLNTALIIGIDPSSAIVNFQTQNYIDGNSTWHQLQAFEALPPAQDDIIVDIDSDSTNSSIDEPEMTENSDVNHAKIAEEIIDWLISSSIQE